MWRLIFSCRLSVLSVALGASILTRCPMASSRTRCRSTTWPTICEYMKNRPEISYASFPSSFFFSHNFKGSILVENESVEQLVRTES